MLYNRVISAVVLIPLIVYVVFFSSMTQFSIFALIICLISSWEWSRLMQFSMSIHCIWICIMFGLLYSTIIIVDQKYLGLDNYYIFFSISSIVIGWWILAFYLVLFYPKSAIFWNKSNILRFCFGILMVLPFFCGILILHRLYHFNNCLYIKQWLFYVLLLIWINDSTAYIIGKKLGQYKLLYKVSPKKTWEGCIGGFLISIAIAGILSKYVITNINNSYVMFILFLITILFAVIGDLTESMFKREAGVKDSSNLIPGHGGLLDRIDSLMSSIPIFTILILFLIQLTTFFDE